MLSALIAGHAVKSFRQKIGRLNHKTVTVDASAIMLKQIPVSIAYISADVLEYVTRHALIYRARHILYPTNNSDACAWVYADLGLCENINLLSVHEAITRGVRESKDWAVNGDI